MFGLDIPLTDFLLIMGFSFLIIRWIVTRLVTTSKVLLLLMDAHGREGREFKAEESLKENRVSYYKQISRRKRERIDLKRKHLPLKKYVGSRLVTIYKAIEGQTETAEWVTSKDKAKVDTDLTYDQLGKAHAVITSLEARVGNLLGVNIQYLLLGFLAGVSLMMILMIAFPEVF